MLVLTRKMNEQILIGDDIKITLVRVRGNAVRIGIEAPREVRVVRSELTLQADVETVPMAKKNSEASNSTKASSKSLVSTSRPIQFPETSRPSVAHGAARQLFVGSVTRDGQSSDLNRVEERRTPLARFMSAQ